MVNEVVATRISKHLKQLYSNSKNGKNGWLKLEIIESETDVSRQTVSRILNGKANKLYYRTAMNLADYIEKETQGKVPAGYLLNESNKNYVGADLRRADFSGEDLTHFNFAQADLTGANFEGATLDHSDFTAARLKDVNFTDVTGTGTTFTGAVATGATFKNFQARFWDMRGLFAFANPIFGVMEIYSLRLEFDGGCAPAENKIRRKFTRPLRFNCKASTVARPVGVIPTMWVKPSAHLK